MLSTSKTKTAFLSALILSFLIGASFPVMAGKPKEIITGTDLNKEDHFIPLKNIQNQVEFDKEDVVEGRQIKITTNSSKFDYQLVSKGIKPDEDTLAVRVKYTGYLSSGGITFGILLLGVEGKRPGKWVEQLAHKETGLFEGIFELTQEDFNAHGIKFDGKRENELCFIFTNCLKDPGVSNLQLEFYYEIAKIQ